MPTLSFTPEPITSAQIAALKQASRICFRTNATHCQIEAIKEAGAPTKRNPFPQETYIEIKTAASITDYARMYSSQSHSHYSCFQMLYGSHPHLQTFASLLKAGDMLTLHWIANNNTESLNAANLHCDSLEIIVERGEKKLTFIIYTQVSPDNSARMVRALCNEYSINL